MDLMHDQARDGGAVHHPTRQLRDRVLLEGAEGLGDADLVALVLGVQPGKAEDLLDAADGRASGLRWCGSFHLRKAGATERQLVRLQAALELGRRALQPSPLNGLLVREAWDVAEHLRAELLHGEQEQILVLGLDARHRVNHRHTAAVGQVDRVHVATADVFRPLVRRGCACVIVAHNHPSGEPHPSPQDEQLTLRLAQVGSLLGIPLLDHIVVARGGHFSFAEQGLLSGPKASK